MLPELTAWQISALAAVIALLGFAIAALALWVRRWPSVPGTIDISIYDVDDDDDDAGKKLFLSYSYSVANRDYAGEKVSPPLLAGLKSDKINSQRYCEKMTVKVYYCPWAPRIACLDHGSLGISLALAVALLGAAVWFIVAVG